MSVATQFPVYEYPHKVKYLVRKHSSNFTRPVYWRVESRNYGQRRGWENLVIGPDWLIQSTIPGREILVCEADLVNDEDSLSLAPNTARDLTMGQATDAFRSIGARAKECMPKQTFRVLRVVLGDSMELFTSGGGHSSTLRERVLKGKEADVLVDSRAPVWLAVLECLEKLVQVKSKSPTDEEPPDEKRRVLLFTDSAEYVGASEYISLTRACPAPPYERPRAHLIYSRALALLPPPTFARAHNSRSLRSQVLQQFAAVHAHFQP